mgnify:CR=1 FL=1
MLFRSRHLLDFSDLVLCTNAILVRDLTVRKRWADRFDYVMVDEIQDTHRSEYRVVYLFARRTGNLALFGDPNQTIYGWRGSDPDSIVEQLKRDFAPVTEISLRFNRRSTPQLLQAAEAFATATFRPNGDTVEPDPRASPGPLPVWHLAEDEQVEAEWIADTIESLQSEPYFQFRRVGVLTANNHYGIGISEVFKTRGLPHLTVEALEFFQRREVKDGLAVLRLLLNPSDTAAMHRVVDRLLPVIARGALARIHHAGPPVGLERLDLLKVETHEYGDPFGLLIDAYDNGRLVVLDVETTLCLHGRGPAVATGMTSVELGTDIGGSVRVPSAFCGVFGHKPSFGVIPTLGYLDEPHGGGTESDVNTFGPIARSARDLALLLDLLAAPTPDRDRKSTRLNSSH